VRFKVFLQAGVSAVAADLSYPDSQVGRGMPTEGAISRYQDHAQKDKEKGCCDSSPLFCKRKKEAAGRRPRRKKR
jgi:hypothetical protein